VTSRASLLSGMPTSFNIVVIEIFPCVVRPAILIGNGAADIVVLR
jgi:hypothetical protein